MDAEEKDYLSMRKALKMFMIAYCAFSPRGLRGQLPTESEFHIWNAMGTWDIQVSLIKEKRIKKTA